jgi:hypothetical protein
LSACWQVLLKPHVDLLRNNKPKGQHWRGEIGTNFVSTKTKTRPQSTKQHQNPKPNSSGLMDGHHYSLIVLLTLCFCHRHHNTTTISIIIIAIITTMLIIGWLLVCPQNTTSWDQWFASYERFFLPYARIAEEEVHHFYMAFEQHAQLTGSPLALATCCFGLFIFLFCV